MLEHKFKVRFSSIAECVVDEDKDKYLALASLETLKPLIPKDVDLDENPDVIIFAANGTVVNRGNKNYHLIDAETALKVAKNFKYKFVDIEHKRNIIVGVITNVGYSKFGSNELLTEEQVIGMKEPFNMCVSGIVWKMPRPKFAEKLLESSNPSSEWHNKISLSWEIGFDDYYLLIGSPNLSEGKTVKDPEEIKAYEPYLRKNGGKNKLADGTPIYVVACGDNVIPLGFGFTTNPAADVEGVLALDNDIELIEEDEESTEKSSIIEASTQTNSENAKENIENSSQQKQHCVNQGEMKFVIKSLEDITKNWSEIVASGEEASASVIDYFSEELKKASDEWTKKNAEQVKTLEQTMAENTQLKSDKEKLEKELEEAQASVAKLQKALEEVQNNLSTLEQEKASKLAEEKFQERMAAVSDGYELNAEAKQIVVAELKEIESDEQFDKWFTRFKVFAKETKKRDGKSEVATASAVAETALNNATIVSPAIPNSSEPQKGFEERFKNAFSKENIEIK